ncbi:hypothetical protein [Roseimaritima ulvae]|uniref:Uncharacterized protein n=1 Tax=Roseimaritima ulvae TaxID=980254 RepID=A0A5B9QN25_9BACT|nr:hypothetical protein [Roseimaritima ulvae]QEG38416.1 hypothetical protein UC8_03730 [Roseimaritima ulvae]
MEDPQTFEQQLSALVPAAHQADTSNMLYRCGFAAGQASRPDSHGRVRPPWLQLTMAACLTAVLVGPVSYRLGHVQQTVTVVERPAAPTAPMVEEATRVEPAAAASQPPEPVDVRTTVAAAPSSVSQPLSPLWGGWLIGLSPPTHSASIVAPSPDIVLTSRPPSADTMAWLEQSRPRELSSPNPINPLLDVPTGSSSGGGPNSNRYRLPPLPSRNSLDTWEPWIQS